MMSSLCLYDVYIGYSNLISLNETYMTAYSYDTNGNLIFQSGGGGNLISGDRYYREYDG